jgi:hypothetical protein
VNREWLAPLTFSGDLAPPKIVCRLTMSEVEELLTCALAACR